MGEYFIKEERVCSLFNVTREEDLKPRPGLNMNPPPGDGRCECCGRPISELKPFPSEGLLKGAYLIKSYREPTVLGEWEEEIMYESQEQVPGEPNRWIKAEFDFSGPLDMNWECSECFILNDEEFYEKMNERIEREEDLALAGS